MRARSNCTGSRKGGRTEEGPTGRGRHGEVTTGGGLDTEAAPGAGQKEGGS